MKFLVEVRENLIYCVTAKSKTLYIFFDKRLKLFSTVSKNQKWSERNAVVFSLLNLKSIIFFVLT